MRSAGCMRSIVFGPGNSGATGAAACRRLRIAALALLLFPLAKALVDAGAIAHGARPINDLIHRAGFWALVFLGVTLAVTPFRRIARYGSSDRRAAHARRRHVLLHRRASRAVLRRPEATISARSLHEITPPLVSHHRRHGLARAGGAGRDLDRRHGAAARRPLRWRRLHQLVYAIALLALIHYFQQTKADVTVPTFAAGAVRLADRLSACWPGGRTRSELSTLSLLALSVVVSLLTFVGEAIGIGIAFHVSPMRVLERCFDFDAGIRPGWQVLARRARGRRDRFRARALEQSRIARSGRCGRVKAEG